MYHRRHFLKASACLATAPHLAGGADWQRPVRLGGLYTVPVAQRWVGRLHDAALNFVVRGEVDYMYVDSVPTADYERMLRQLSETGTDLIIGDAFAHEESARLISREFPNVVYLMGSVYRPDSQFQNFHVFDSYIQDASHLSGIIGGSLTRSGKIGIVGRHAFPTINRLMNAFIDGTREFRTDIEITVNFQNSWYDPRRAAELTYDQIASGTDVIYADAPGAARAAGESGIPVIGSFSGMDTKDADRIVTTARWHFEPTLQATLVQLERGRPAAMDFGIYSYMRHSGCSLAPVGAFLDQIPEEAVHLAVLRESEMRSRRFTANLNSERPFSGLFPAIE